METGELLGVFLILVLLGLMFGYPLLRSSRCPACGRLGAIKVTIGHWRIKPPKGTPRQPLEPGEVIELVVGLLAWTQFEDGVKRPVLRERIFRCRFCGFERIVREQITCTGASHLPVIYEDEI